MVSPDIEAEYIENTRKHSVMRLLARNGIDGQAYLNVLADLRRNAELVRPTGAPPPCRDEKDRKYLHCALAARVDFLISWDRDLLDLGHVGRIPILTPSAFLARAEEAGRPLDP